MCLIILNVKKYSMEGKMNDYHKITQRNNAMGELVKYRNIKEEVEDLQRKLRNYELSNAYKNTWFDGANLSYKPEKTLDEKATALVRRYNAMREHFASVMAQLDEIKRVAQSKMKHHQNIIDNIDKENML